MAILAECPVCHNKQSTRNKVCSGKNGCGTDLDEAKRSKKVKYWIMYRLPNGKQRKEAVSSFEGLNPYSIEDVRGAEAKRTVQKRERRIFDMLPEANMTFSELTEWYLNLKVVRRLSSHERLEICLANFNEVFGNQLVGTLKPMDLEEYQDKREGQGLSPATIDMELTVTGSMVRKAWDNDMVDGRTVKAFRKVKRKLKTGANARKRTLMVEEYLKIREKAVPHIKALVTVGYHTGMRRGELVNLKWNHIDRENDFIRLPAELTKENKTKSIPMNHHVKTTLEALPRALHHEYVFTYGGKPISIRFRTGFMNACESAGILYGQNVEGGLRFHDLRATFDTNMDSAGVSESCRKAILGHSFRGMDRHYLRLSDEDLKEAIDKYTTWIDTQFANVTQSVTQEEKNVSH